MTENACSKIAGYPKLTVFAIPYFLLTVTFSVIFLFSVTVADPVYADTTTVINFDPPNYSVGSILWETQGVKFANGAEVFSPTVTSTQSSPNALRTQHDCSPTTCPDDATHLAMTFPQSANFISVRVGTEGPFEGCFPENADCNLYGRLVGYDSNGNAVSDSRDVLILYAGENSKPLTTEISISDSFGRIKSATIFFGKGMLDPAHQGFPERVQIDDLTFTIPSTYLPHLPPTKPTITITSPIQDESVKVTNTLYLRGSVSIPGGLYAFCTALNNPFLPSPQDQCNQTSHVNAYGLFNVWFDGTQLKPGRNSLYVFVYDLNGQSAIAKVDVIPEKPASPIVTFTYPKPSARTNYIPGTPIFGNVHADGGITSFCTRQNDPVVPSSAKCSQLNELDSSGGFKTTLGGSNSREGINTLYAYAYDRWGGLGSGKIELTLPVDIRITGMEITQGIQKEQIQINTDGVEAYDGVRLIAGGKTVVRLFANVNGRLPVDNVSAQLYLIYRPTGDFIRVKGPIDPDNGRRNLNPGSLEVTSDRMDENGAYTFTLPPEWTVWRPSTAIGLFAEIDPVYNKYECNGCGRNNQFFVPGIYFQPVRPIDITPIEIIWKNSSGDTIRPSSNPTDVFARTASISPISETGLQVRPYSGAIDVTDTINDAQRRSQDAITLAGRIIDRIAVVEDIHNLPGYVIGVSRGLNNGLEVPKFFSWPPRGEPIAYVDEGPGSNKCALTICPRPLSIVTHEFYHSLGFYHAGMSCPPGFPTIYWHPDDRGQIHGIGLDRRTGSGQLPGTYRIISPGYDGQPKEWVDFMSYCSNNSWIPSNGDYNVWLSVRNWEAFGSLFPNGITPDDLLPPGIASDYAAAKPNVATTRQPTLRIVALANETGNVTILRVEPGDGQHLITGNTESSYRLVIRNQSGSVISSTTLAPLPGHIPNERSPIYLLSAEVPAGGAAKVEVTHNNTILDERIRSANAPKVTILSPSIGVHIRGAGETIVSWNATDLDGDTLQSRVEYSNDNGRIFHVLTSGVKGNEVSLPNRLFSSSLGARVKVVANDGFNEGSAVSARFIADGTEPQVHIIDPPQNAQVLEGTTLHLVGEAYDDRSQSINGTQLRWFVGNEMIGTGRQVSEPMLHAGTNKIRLEARDEKGRMGNTTILLQVVDGDKNREQNEKFTIASLLNDNLYVIHGKSATVKGTSFTISPNTGMKVEFSGKGEVELDIPKYMISEIFKISTRGNDLPFENIQNSSSTNMIRFTLPGNVTSVDIFGTTLVPEFRVKSHN